MVYSHHLITDNVSMCSFGAPCSHLTVPPTTGGKAAPAEAGSGELLSSLAFLPSQAVLSKRMQMKGNLTRLCLRRVSSALFP